MNELKRSNTLQNNNKKNMKERTEKNATVHRTICKIKGINELK